MIKMMVIVVLVYSICWLPYNILMIINESVSEKVMMYIYFPLHGLAMSHACYNPIIYCFMNTRFRDGLFLLLGAMPCFNRYFTGTPTSSFPHTGIGLEAAKDFAKRGARVILACRDEQKAIEAKELIINETNNHDIKVGLVNFASLQSVREFAKNVIDTEDRLDILVNNAGVATGSNRFTSDGLPLSMQVNYFGPVLLTLLLIDLLKKCNPSRIINVSSTMAKYAKLTPENFNKYPGSYAAYNNSKLGNILFTMKLAKLLKHSGVSVFSLHPGAIRTQIFRRFTGIKKALLDVIMILYFKLPRTDQEWKYVSKQFEGRWNFSYCLEAIDEKHLDSTPCCKYYLRNGHE